MTSKDNWTVHVQPSVKFGAPTFLRLFIINRVLHNIISCGEENTYDDAIRAIITSSLEDTEMKNVAVVFLSSLCQQGLMNIVVDDDLIDKIFNKLILTKFGDEYSNITTYKSRCAINIANKNQRQNKNNDNDQENNVQHDDDYKAMVFNTNDLMSLIFHYLEYLKKRDEDLSNCSLVCTHWFYHSFNLNSIYHVNLHYLLIRSRLSKVKIRRLWQRVVNGRSVTIVLGHSAPKPDDFILSQILMVANIEKLRCVISPNHILYLKGIMQQCSNNIKDFNVNIKSTKKRNVLTPLKLFNARKIRIHNLYFYILWSYKCQQLYLSLLKKIDNKWCNFVIYNCDCSGIKHLTLDDIEFHSKIVNKHLIFSRLAKKFTNLKKLDIILWYEGIENALLFWQQLLPIIDKNDAKVSILTHFREEKQATEFSKHFANHDDDNINSNNTSKSKMYKMNKLRISLDSNVLKSMRDMISRCSGLEYLILEAGSMPGVKSFINELNGYIRKLISDPRHPNDIINVDEKEYVWGILMKSKSLQKIEIHDTINPLQIFAFFWVLQLVEVIDKLNSNVYVVLKLSINNILEEKMDTFLPKFKEFCQKIVLMMLQHKVAINVEFTIFAYGVVEKIETVFTSICDENVDLSKYKQPELKDNKYCEVLSKPSFIKKVNCNSIISFQFSNCRSTFESC